jgi:D-serine deaminase-like pyridoxal phosphate-dependent protein
MIGRPSEPEFRGKLVPLIAESLGPFAATFLVLNGDHVSAKAATYKELDSLGYFSFILAMQAIADMQVEDYALQSGATAFATRIVTNAPMLSSMGRICSLDSFKSIGTVDEGARTRGLEALGRDL